MTAKEFSEIRATIPLKPGVYRYYDSDDRLLYVGKAKNLRKRVSSYFVKKKLTSSRMKMLLKNIHRIDFTIVENERDALFLENSIIKANQPKYNIALKDDKTYPYIVIKNEQFPRVFFTRKLIKDGSEYFGPYTSIQRTRNILKFIKKIYPIRTCNLKLSQENIKKGKFKVCLEYHIKNCLGPCEGYQTEMSYDSNINQIRQILKGNVSEIRNEIQQRMEGFASQLEFELAADMKYKLDAIDQFTYKSQVVNPKLSNIDAISIVSDDKVAFANYIKINEGNIVQVQSVEIKKSLNETDYDLLIYALYELQERGIKLSKEILVPFEIELPEDDITITVPKIGDKYKLIQLCTKNARLKLQNKQIKREEQLQQKKINPVLLQIKEDLRLKEIPYHIECFDNSNFQGSQPVASCVVFRNGKPYKSDYRKFNIKTVVGPDDFASMEEVVYRRYKHLLEEDLPLPQLVIVDGGKGQLSSAMKSIKLLGLQGKITVIGIAKKLEEIYFPGDQYPLHINKRSPSLKVIQHLRNEAHRFAITFHRSKRAKNTLKTELTNIDGIGSTTAQKLLTHFKSIKKIKQASEEELLQVVNKKVAKSILDYYAKQNV